MELKNIVNSYNITNILGYLRRSRQDMEREKRTGEDTLTEQKELMNKILTAIEIPYELKMEIGSGESIEGRPVFKECLKDLEEGKYQAIAVKEITRLSRGSYSDAGQIVNLLQSKRLIIITPYKVYDPRNPVDMRQIRFELFMAREEFEMTRERMTGAKYTYAAQGKWISGLAPYGYQLNKKTSKLDPVEDEAKVVELIFDLFLNGLNGKDYSYNAIATHLTNLQIPSPAGKKKWNRFTVKAILENEAYIGTVKYKVREKEKDGKRTIRPENEQIIVPDAHTPIIDKDQFQEANKKIENKIPLLPNRSDYKLNELAGVCICADCGGPLSKYEAKRKRQNKNGTESLYHVKVLRCLNNKCMNVRYNDVEEAILDYLKYLQALNDNDLTKHLGSVIQSHENKNNIRSKKQMNEQFEQREKELKNKLNFIFDKYESGIYSDEIFLQRKSVLDKELQELKKAKDEINGLVDFKGGLDINQLKENIKNAIELYESSENREEKNKLLRIMLQKVIVKMTAKRKGPIPAQFEITPILRYNFLIGETVSSYES
ncbi:recombinase family protein [Bacillus subtilis]|uniref:recombinase family protein n=1 Tax=Bacillales TaxID=1385 RepID=UPI000D6F0654|nr:MULTISPECIES: recombinase family protein [Bacillales]MBL3637520.1 recombinase family protein [Alkalicoccobacillus gibsonii]MBW4823385.1 recombinase family protein [Bacillaceae bacterium]QMV48930.1 site-specific recombinase [Bacillus phage vB_BsuS-Goe12]QMV49104.1 site-specific recombinase [Bacillus phage vB_BsuS-Goe13]AXF33477.1 recombinase family protein [Bacillus sp. DM2]